MGGFVLSQVSKARDRGTHSFVLSLLCWDRGHPPAWDLGPVTI